MRDGATRLPLSNEDGATGLEYGLLWSMLALVSIGAWRAVGSEIIEVFRPIAMVLGYQGAFPG